MSPSNARLLLGPPGIADLADEELSLPPMGFTENNSATFLSSGDPCVDFFFHVVPNTPATTTTELLTSAWHRDPLTALKLVCHLRGIRGAGKSDREGFYASALWLHANHPKTLALNAPAFAEFGYIKDLLEILYRIINGPDACQLAKAAGTSPRSKFPETSTKRKRSAIKNNSSKNIKKPLQKKSNLAARAVQFYNSDLRYQFLHDRIAEFFASLLASDVEKLKSGETNKIGLAAKWCPSLDSSFDKSTLLCESIARRMFPRDSHPEYVNLEERHYAYKVRNQLRRDVLVPLRAALQLPEVYMCAGKWDSLPYNRVASVALKTYKSLFFNHDKDCFSEFLDFVKEGKAKISAGALLPHEIIAPFLKFQDSGSSSDSDSDDEVAELQWRRMVDDLLKIGKLSNCIAVCDVSESMDGTPMKVCVALGILMSELSEEPWKGRAITFSEKPHLHKIQGETLREKTRFVSQMQGDMSTNFQAVLDNILAVAVKGKLKAEEMIKRVFVFSGMESDRASGNTESDERPNRHWDTDYEVIRRKFEAAGYGSCVPEIVFWNLKDSKSTPVTSNQKGVALVSGFSKNLMKAFLEGGEFPTPMAVMEAAIAGEEYQKLVVFD